VAGPNWPWFQPDGLLRHLIAETEESVRLGDGSDSGSLRKIAFPAFLKVLLPVETLAATQAEEAQILRKEWDEAYTWLGEKERGRSLELGPTSL